MLNEVKNLIVFATPFQLCREGVLRAWKWFGKSMIMLKSGFSVRKHTVKVFRQSCESGEKTKRNFSKANTNRTV